MALGSCSTITVGLALTCAAATAPGGLVSRIYITNFDDIASYTQDATSKVILTMVMESGKKFWRFVGLPEQHSVTYELQAGNNFNPWKVTLNGVFYADTTLDREYIDSLKNATRIIAVVERNAGYMEVLGLDVASGTVSDPEGGLKAESGSGGSGVMKQDDSSFKIALSGMSSHLPKKFVPSGGTLAAAITYMEGLAT